LEISPYKISVFRQCRRRYRYHYVDGLWKRYRKPKPYLTMGDHLHATLNAFLSPLTPPEDRTLEHLESLLRKRWAVNRSGFRDIADERCWGMRALDQLRLFFDTQDVMARPWLSEAVHKVRIGEGLVAMGRVDRVDRCQDGVVIIDYKSGKQRETKDQPQLMTYALLIGRKFGVPVLRVSYLYLSTGETISLEPNDAQIDITAEELLSAAGQILCETEYLPSVGPLCRYCDFEELCSGKGRPPQGGIYSECVIADTQPCESDE
jgi:putative RecB family exonuclease